MRIDAHHHVWDLAAREQPWTTDIPLLRRTFGVDELRPALREHRIDATVVVQTLPVEPETPELLRLAAADPQVAAVVGWVELTAPDVGDRLARLRELPGGEALVGVRHGVQDEADPDWLLRPEVRRGIVAVGAAGLVYELLIRPDQLAAAVRTVADLPDVRFVLDHAGNPEIRPGALSPWAAHVTALAACPNAAVKLSGLVTRTEPWSAAALRPYADTLLETLGPDRLMFGSDWPVCLLAAGYDEVIGVAEELTSALSPPERAAVFGTTAADWYGITA
ncbi:MAG: L-fuconolactonase [Streptomyces sp.]|nr:L-fuconolactonase [Streptomyces sp.]